MSSWIRRFVGSHGLDLRGTYGRRGFVALELFDVKVLDEVYKDPKVKSEDHPSYPILANPVSVEESRLTSTGDSRGGLVPSVLCDVCVKGGMRCVKASATIEQVRKMHVR